MIKELLGQLAMSHWAEASLLIFCGVFIAVVIRTLRSDKATCEAHAEIALSDTSEGH